MRWPVTFLGLGAGAPELLSVRACARLSAAGRVVADGAEALAVLAPRALRLDAGGLSAAEIAAQLRAGVQAGEPTVRAYAGTIGASVRALDELRLLLAAEVSVEVIPTGPGDALNWPWRERLPLAGKRIAVTRPRAALDALAELLIRLGAEVVSAPALELAPPLDLGPLDRALEGIHRYEVLTLTSAAGVDRLVDRLLELGKDLRWLDGLKIAAVGTGTAQALRARGLVADLVPTEHRGEGLARLIQKELRTGARVLLARAAEGREVLPVELVKAGALVDVVPVYRSVPTAPQVLAPLAERLAAGTLDVVTFASTSAARQVIAALGGVEALAGVTVACLGPVTAQGCAALGLAPRIVAANASFEGLAEALCDYFEPR